MFKQKAKTTTLLNVPTHQLLIVLDPRCVPSLLEKHLSTIKMIAALKQTEPKLEINMLVPIYLADYTTLTTVRIMKSVFHKITKPPPDFQPDKLIPKEDLGHLQGDDHSLSLLSLADAVKADGIVTLSEVLIRTRHSVYQYHRIRIIPLDEFDDVIEAFAHGHSIFWSVSLPIPLTVDALYYTTHWKNARLSKWFYAIADKITNKDLKNTLHNALLNRYPLLLYTREMILFYALQKDFYRRHGRLGTFNSMLAYYLHNFYMLLWGLLEQLTLIAKYARELEIVERECGIQSNKFWKEFGAKEPGLRTFIRSTPINAWINELADIRHTAAHRMITIPTSTVLDTEDSKKSDEEILEIIRKKRAVESSLLPKGLLREIEKTFGPIEIHNWRMKRMKCVEDNVILFKRRDGKWYKRAAVISVDYDLERANAILDAFLVCLFRKQPKADEARYIEKQMRETERR